MTYFKDVVVRHDLINEFNFIFKDDVKRDDSYYKHDYDYNYDRNINCE